MRQSCSGGNVPLAFNVVLYTAAENENGFKYCSFAKRGTSNQNAIVVPD